MNLSRGSQSVEMGHGYVQDYEIRFQVQGLLNRLLAVSGFMDRDAGTRGQYCNETPPHNLMIVGHKNYHSFAWEQGEAVFVHTLDAVSAFVINAIRTLQARKFKSKLVTGREPTYDGEPVDDTTKKDDGEKENAAVTLPGTVQKIIPANAGEPEKAEVVVEGAEELYREIRVENTLQDPVGNPVAMKKGAKVEVTIEAPPERTDPKK
jgi:hypothetical protein